MSSASIETTLELWASSLRDVKARMRPLFGDVRVARRGATGGAGFVEGEGGGVCEHFGGD